MTQEGKPSWGFRFALFLTLVLALGLVLLGLYLLLFPIEARDFQSSTGQDWKSFSSANREVADFIEREARLLAMATVGVGLLTLFVVWYGLRDRTEIALKTTWTLPVILVGVAAVFLLADNLLLAGISAGIAALTAVILAVSRRWMT